MRQGNLSVTVNPVNAQPFHENPDGTVSVQRDAVYVITITNHAARRALVNIAIDGRSVTPNGLVLAPHQIANIERPIEGDPGRFTVFAEGREDVFGPSGGRDNPDLGLIRVTHQLEQEPVRWYATPVPYYPYPNYYPVYPYPRYVYGSLAPSNADIIIGSAGAIIGSAPTLSRGLNAKSSTTVNTSFSSCIEPTPTYASNASSPSGVNQALPANYSSPLRAQPATAAGTGLTGHSDQEFTPTSIGALESHITTIALRLVLCAAMSWSTPRPLHGSFNPLRPEPRP